MSWPGDNVSAILSMDEALPELPLKLIQSSNRDSSLLFKSSRTEMDGEVSTITRRFCFLPVILALLLLLASCGSPPDTARVIRVIDGDTITIDGGQRVRYIGIDTPETYPVMAAFAIEAWQANRELVEGKQVRLEKDVSETDKYGRLLRYVWVDSTLVNAELVKRGLARAKAYPPDTRYRDHLEQLEAEAKEAGRGMWAR